MPISATSKVIVLKPERAIVSVVSVAAELIELRLSVVPSFETVACVPVLSYESSRTLCVRQLTRLMIVIGHSGRISVAAPVPSYPC